MKLLTSTHKGQGQRKSDFCWCRDGELLYIGFECDHTGGADGPCGCQRSFIGMDTHLATTTGEVIEAEYVTEAQFLEVYMASLERAGWLKLLDHPGDMLGKFRQEAVEWLEILSHFKPGVILEKRCDVIQIRDIAAESVGQEDRHGG